MNEQIFDTWRSTPFCVGQRRHKIYVMPLRHLVIAITSNACKTNYGQQRSLDILLGILANAASYGVSIAVNR